MTGQMDAILDTMASADEVMAAATTRVRNAVTAIFADLPFVNVIAIAGDTPYFCDGDLCEWGIETQVDWLGDCYRAPEEEILKLQSEPEPAYAVRDSHPNHESLMKARQLLAMFERDLFIMDNGDNGTWWMFTRNENGFDSTKGNYDHE